jgi:FlaA1/EpsC-like NDP-sugar epimerase
MKVLFGRMGPRVWVTIGIYVGILIASFYLAYELRFDFALPPEMQEERIRLLPLAVCVKFVGLVLLRQTGSMLRYFGIPDLVRVSSAMAVASALLITPRLLTQVDYIFPRGVLLIDLMLSIAGLCVFRIALRVYQERISSARRLPNRKLEKIAIVGAGDTGASLANDLLNTPARGLKPVAFLDDDPKKRGRLVHGVPIIGKPEELADAQIDDVTTVVIAMPSAPQKRVQEIVLFLAKWGYQVEIVPALEDLASGRAKVSRIRPVDVEDLLGRKAVELDCASIRKFVEDKTVMVTGAGGSIGSELCRQIAHLNPHRLLLVDQSEPNVFLIEQEMNGLGMGAIATPLVADILDAPRVDQLFTRYRPQIVFHAAAHKHVYLMERQPGEAIRNNSVGTRLLAEAAARHEVEAFVLISTDKAINPTNVMGASKRLAEIHLQATHTRLRDDVTLPAQHTAPPLPAHIGLSAGGVGRAQDEETITYPQPAVAGAGTVCTKFMAVRFGNVLGSSGSVVPIFRQQIAAGGPVTVTHPDVTRYFMTIPEAVGLVMQAAVLGEGGEIFVLDMGKPMKIADLARQMIELSGFRVGEDIEIKFTGLRPGEKLFEELQHHDEQYVPTDHPRIMRFLPKGDAVNASARAIDQLEPILYTAGANLLKQQLQAIVPEYTPHLE